MLREDPRLSALIRTFEEAGCRYIAQSLSEAVKSTLTPEGSTASELALTATAKRDWEAAERALSEYQLSGL